MILSSYMFSICTDAILVAGCSSILTYSAYMFRSMFLLGLNGVVRTVFQVAVRVSIIFILSKVEGCFIHGARGNTQSGICS